MGLDTGLIAAYDFENSLADAHTGGLNWGGTAFGYAPGKVGQALLADHTSSTTIPRRAAPFVTSGSFSVEVWLFATQDASGMVWGQLIGPGIIGSLSCQQGIVTFGASGGLIVGKLHNSNDLLVFGSSFLNRWTHIVLVYDDSITRGSLYVDGALGAQSTLTANYAGLNSVSVGGQDNGTTKVSMFDGRIDLFRVWSRPLTDSEVTALYNGGAGLSYDQLTPDVPIISEMMYVPPARAAQYFAEESA